MKPYYEHAGITIYHGDCREIMPLQDEVGLLLTDPPYGGGLAVDFADRFKTKAGKWWNVSDRSGQARHTPIEGDDEPFDPALLLRTKAQHKILWGANWYASRLPNSGGWWVWDKRNGSRDVSEADVRVFRHTWFGLIRDSERDNFCHPTQKPVALMRWCIENSKTDGLILDPFMGTGPIEQAAKQLGRPVVGIEKVEKYCEIAAKRLSQEVLDFK
jgi:site-specific DNA-methyltransferase (adenine-specific)